MMDEGTGPLFSSQAARLCADVEFEYVLSVLNWTNRLVPLLKPRHAITVPVCFQDAAGEFRLKIDSLR